MPAVFKPARTLTLDDTLDPVQSLVHTSPCCMGNSSVT